jgi:hypothetical protein
MSRAILPVEFCLLDKLTPLVAESAGTSGKTIQEQVF